MVSALEEKFLDQLEAAGLPDPEREVCFAYPWRRWRFDFVFRDPILLAIEVDGATFCSGAHSKGQGGENDQVKGAVAAFLGWHVFRVNAHMIQDGRALYIVQAALGRFDPRDAAEQLANWRCRRCDVAGTKRRQRERKRAKEAKLER